MLGSAASGGWESCGMSGECKCVTNLFFNNLLDTVNYLLNFYQVDQNSRCLKQGNLDFTVILFSFSVCFMAPFFLCARIRYIMQIIFVIGSQQV